MPKKFTVAEQAIITKSSQDLYRYLRICEEHSAVLRKDPEACRKAHQEYIANSPPLGFMPSCNEYDRHIEEAEKVIKKECRTALEYAVYKFDGSNSANLLFSVAMFMWCVLASFFASS